MVCEVELSQVMRVAKGNYPLGQEEEFELIAHFGYLPTLVTFEHLSANCTYLATVPSLNVLGDNHRIVVKTVDNGVIKVYDPNKGREGKKYYDSREFRSWTQLTRITRYKEQL
jgi:hypothetical protein